MRALFLMAITTLAILAFLAGCAPAVPTAAPAAPTKPAAAPAATAPAAASTAPAAPAAATKPAAPAATATPAVQVKRGGTLRFIIQNDVPTFDAPLCKGGNTPLEAVFDLLAVWRQNKDGVWGPTPALANSWETQGKEVTFKLKKGVKFHDGTDFNAKSAKWNLERAAFDKKSRLRSSLATIDSVSVVDDYTVKVNLKTPDASLLSFLTDAPDTLAAMQSQAAMEKLGEDEFGRKPVGTGPMEFVEWVSGDHVTVKKFAGFWDKGLDGQPLPYLDGIRYRIVVDDSVRYTEIKAGTADVIAQIHPKDYPGVKANPDLVYFDAEWKPNSAIVTFNMESGPFAKNKALRQATVYSIDKEAVAKTLGMGLGKGAKGQLIPGMIGYDPTLPYYAFDPAKAKQLIQSSGVPTPVEVHVMVHNRNQDMQAAQMYKQMMDAAGFNALLDIAERTANIAKREAGNFEFMFLNQSHSADPDEQFSLPYSCGSSGNFARYCNKDFDKCLLDARSTYDVKQRADLYKKCQQIIYEDLPMDWIYDTPTNAVFANYVKGYIPDWWIKEVRTLWLDK